MKFGEKKAAGSARISDSPTRRALALAFRSLLFAAASLLAGAAFAQALYKYRGDNGEWIYSDRAPETATGVEVRDLPKGMRKPSISVYDETLNGAFYIVARNEFHAPIQVILGLDWLDNLDLPPAEQQMQWVVPPRTRMILLKLEQLDPDVPGNAGYRYVSLPGDPDSVHAPSTPYRAPFAVASNFQITQAFPTGITHLTPDSYYAVDLTMPVGTDIYAARAGTVFEVASTNFRGGIDPDRDLPSANLIRILHDDGTYAVYAHLNWNTIRVRPGDTVVRGEYIADSGNTGFSSGPHLHFAVIRNKGLRLESVPVVFEGQNGREVVPTTGNDLVAY